MLRPLHKLWTCSRFEELCALPLRPSVRTWSPSKLVLLFAGLYVLLFLLRVQKAANSVQAACLTEDDEAIQQRRGHCAASKHRAEQHKGLFHAPLFSCSKLSQRQVQRS